MTKVCKTCKIEKDLSEFYKQKRCKLGVRADCKTCMVEKRTINREIKSRRNKINKMRDLGIKKCSGCLEIKNVNNFHKAKHHSDGLTSRCKSCVSIRTSNYNSLEFRKRRLKEYDKFWRENNKGKKNAKEAKRRAAKLKRTPHWADLEAIEEFYKNCPEGYEVDHIYPLQGNICSGLHVLDNLQYLTASENRRKRNKFPEKVI